MPAPPSPADWTATTLAGRIARREVSAAEAARAHLDRIEALDDAGPRLHAFLSVARDEAERGAGALDRDLASGRPAGPLAGIPVAVKDNICARGLPATAGSRILEGWIPPYDATVVSRLRAAGAIIVGKTNCDEFGMGSSTENSAYGPARNPWDTDRVPGGSSGGSAAAVAARMAPLALGSDTGGSIRQPAALCGVVGLKPTYGLVSRYGLVAFASSLDQVGPIARSPLDAARLLSVIAGRDPMDSTTLDLPLPDYEGETLREPGSFRFAVPPECLGEGLDPAVRERMEEGCRTLERIGGTRVEAGLPTLPHAIATYYIIAPAEASSNLARYDGVRYGGRTPGAPELSVMYSRTRDRGFGAEVKRRILLGTWALSAGYHDAFYRKASQVRTLIRRDFERAFEAADVLVTPTSPVPAFRLGERLDDPLRMYLCDIYTVPASLSGLPAISIPCGFVSPSGAPPLPAGMQLVGPALSEGMLLRIAHGFLGVMPFDGAPPLPA